MKQDIIKTQVKLLSTYWQFTLIFISINTIIPHLIEEKGNMQK